MRGQRIKIKPYDDASNMDKNILNNIIGSFGSIKDTLGKYARCKGELPLFFSESDIIDYDEDC